MTQHTHPNRLLAQIALAVLAIASAHAANFTWTGGAGNGTWSVGANWGGTAPTGVSTDNMTFTGNTQTSTVNDLTANATFGTISFTNNNTVGSAAAFNLSGNAITLGGNIAATTSTTVIADTIANDLVLSGSASRTVTAAGNHTIALTGNVTFATANNTVFGFNDASAFSGAGGTIIFQNSASTPTLSYTGSSTATISRAITVSGTGNGLGNLRASNANSQIIYNGVFTGVAGQQFSLDGSNTGVTSDWQSDFGNGNNTTTNVQKGGTGNWLISGAIKTGAGTLSVTNGNLTVNNATSNFTGGVTLTNGGQLNFTSIGNSTQASALGAGNLITLSNNSSSASTLNYIGSTNMTTNRTIKLGNVAGAATDVFTGVISNNGNGTLVWTNSTFMPTQTGYNGTRSLVLSGTNTGANEIRGAIIDQTAVTAITNLTKNGTGTWVLSGNNTYSGNTNVNAGTLVISGAFAGTGQLIVNNAAILQFGDGTSTSGSATSVNTGQSFPVGTIFVNNTGTVQLNFANNGTLSNAVASNPSATTTLSGANAAGTTNTFTATSYNNGGGFAVNSTNAGAVLAFSGSGGAIDLKGTNVTVGGAGDTLFTSAGQGLYSSSGTGSVTKNGTGTLIYQGNQGYTGTTAINAGAIRIDTAQTNGGTYFVGNGGTTGTSASLLLGGGAAGLSGGISFNRTISVNGGASGNRIFGGTNTSGTNTFASNITFSGSDNDGTDRSITLTAATGGTVNFTGGLTSGGINVGQNVTKTGNGTVQISSTGNYYGTTTINAGTLVANAANAMQNTSGITVNSGGTLLLNTNGTINDSATVTLVGGTYALGGAFSETVGSLTLSANSTIDFGAGFGASTLTFNGTYTPTFKLTVSNFDVGDVLILGGNVTSSLSNTSLFSFSGGFTSSFGSGVTTITAVPEPGTIAAGLVIVGFIAWRERKRLALIVRRSTKSAVIS